MTAISDCTKLHVTFALLISRMENENAIWLMVYVSKKNRMTSIRVDRVHFSDNILVNKFLRPPNSSDSDSDSRLYDILSATLFALRQKMEEKSIKKC